jgi:hypothetical protein
LKLAVVQRHTSRPPSCSLQYIEPPPLFSSLYIYLCLLCTDFIAL